MRSPKELQIIQIDITNACPHTCSNCTRFIVINQGCLYVTDNVLTFNVRTMSPRKFFSNGEPLPQNFWICYPPDKVTEINISAYKVVASGGRKFD